MTKITAIKPEEPDDLDGLISDALSGLGQPLHQAETLPPEAYTSDAFFRLEVEKIFLKEWLCVGHVSQVPAVGDYYPFDLFDDMLVVARAPDKIRVMSRVCPHRWAPLVSEPGNARFFSCPFHKWAFALDGTMLGAPLMDTVEFDTASCRMTEYRTEVVAGFIYMTFSAEAPPLAPRLAGLAAHLDKFKIADLVEGFVLDYDARINWKIVVETFMECYHHIAAHPETFERVHPARMSYVEDGDAAWTLGHAPARADVPNEALLGGFPLLTADLTPEERREFRLYLIYPYHLFFMLPDRAALYCMQPMGPTRTRYQARFLMRPEAKDDPDHAARLAAERAFFETFNNEDLTINEMQQRGVASRSARVGRFCGLEKACWQLAEYVRGRLRD